MAGKIRVMTMLGGIAIGDPLGGAERLGVDIARRLDRGRFAPSVCALWRYDTRAEAEWLDLLTAEGIPVLFAASATRKQPFSFAGALQSIARQSVSHQADILHSYLPLSALAAMLLKRKLDVAALVRTAAAGHEWGDGPTSFLARQVLTNWVYPLAFDQEACVSRDIQARFDRRPGARLAGKRIIFAPSAVDLTRYRPRDNREAARRDLGLPHDTLVVGSVGRLSQEKGFGDLLEAAALVRGQLSGVTFAHFGNGPLRSVLERRAAELDLTDAFRFFGARTDLPALYGAMDLLVLPSHWEGLPGVVIEAMACGVPVVATDIPGTRELVGEGETGWLAPPADPPGLALVIIAALRAPGERQSRAARALAEVAPRYDIGAVARQYEAVYERLARSAGRGEA